MLGQHSQPTPTFIGSKVYACLGITCHLHFLQNDRGRRCGNTGVERTPNKNQYTAVTCFAGFVLNPPTVFRSVAMLELAKQNKPLFGLFVRNIICDVLIG